MATRWRAGCATSHSCLVRYFLVNAPIGGHDLHEVLATGDNQTTDHVSPCFAHLPSQTLSCMASEGTWRCRARWAVFSVRAFLEHDSMTSLVVVAFRRRRSVIFLSSATFAGMLSSVDHGVAKCHGIDRDHAFRRHWASTWIIPKPSRPRGRSVDIAGGYQVGHEILRDHIGRVG